MPKQPPNSWPQKTQRRARLEKAEQTLHEIFSGGVDALVIPGADSAQLFTLQGADQVCRVLIKEMSEGALTMTAEGVILYANPRLAEIFPLWD